MKRTFCIEENIFYHITDFARLLYHSNERAAHNSLRAFVDFIITMDGICNLTCTFSSYSSNTLQYIEWLSPASLYHLFLPTGVYLWVAKSLISVHTLFSKHSVHFRNHIKIFKKNIILLLEKE